MTEDEARKKWCPFAISPVVHLDSTASGNRFSMGKNSEAGSRCLCIGSGCMAWRGVTEEKVSSLMDAKDYVAVDYLKDGESVVNAIKRYREESVQTIHSGYCGLAGRQS